MGFIYLRQDFVLPAFAVPMVNDDGLGNGSFEGGENSSLSVLGEEVRPPRLPIIIPLLCCLYVDVTLSLSLSLCVCVCVCVFNE